MAIKDIQEQLKKSEGQSGEFLFKQLEADLNAVYNAGYGDEKTPLLDSYWKEARDEFSDEGKRAVKKGKSKEAKEVLKDLETFQKSLEATEEISGSGIGAGTMAMLNAVKPHIEKRAKALSKNEGIFKTMKKKAVASAVGAVEGFASGLLAPLPFGAGEAIIEKTKGFLGAGKGDKVERQAEQAVSFAGRIEREGGEVAGTGGGGAAGNGGVVAGGGEGSGGNLGETNEILRDILDALKPDRETAREEEREDDREHKALLDAMKAGGTVVGEGEDGGDTNIVPLMGLGKWSKIISVATMAAVIGSMIVAIVAAAWEMTEGELGKMGKKIGEKKGKEWREKSLLGKIPGVGAVGETIAGGTANLEAQKMGMVFKLLNFLGLTNVKMDEHKKGIFEIGKTGPGMVSKGDTILDNKASKDFKEGMGTFKGLMGHEEGIGTVQSDYLAKLHKGEVQIKGGMSSVMEQVVGMLTEKFGSNPIFGPSEGRTPSQLKKIGYSGLRKSMEMKEYMWRQQKDVSELAQMLLSGDSMENDWTYMGDAMIDMAPHKGMLFKDVMSTIGGKTLQTVKEITKQAKQAEKFEYGRGTGKVGYEGFEKDLVWGGMRSVISDKPFAYGEESRMIEKMADASISELLLPLKSSFMGGQMDLEDIQEKIKFSEKFAGMSPEGIAGMKGKVEKGRLEYRGMREFREMQLAKQNQILEEKSQKSIAETIERERLKKRKGGVIGQQKFVFKDGKMVVADQAPKEPSWMSGKYGLNLKNISPMQEVPAMLHGGEEVIEGPQIARIEKALAGNQLNNAAYDKVGLRGQGGVINAPIINAPTSVSNNTITPSRRIAARGPRTPGFTDHLFS